MSQPGRSMTFDDSIEREITPIKPDDFFIILNHKNAKFDFPVHYHPEYELNLVLNSSGKRIVGDSLADYQERDLVLIGPNTYHAWKGDPAYKNCRVVTIQFHEDLFSESFLNKKLMGPIKEMLDRSKRGIEFAEATQDYVIPKILDLTQTTGFDSFLAFLSLLFDLSISRDQKVLCSPTFQNERDTQKSRRIQKVVDHIHSHYMDDIKLPEVSAMINMSETAFSHFFKKRTHKSFSDYLIDIRIGHASRSLLETNKNISEICYECGFNNLSNFNRIFKKKKNCTPSQFRDNKQIISNY